jgi:uncharacterized damage-inducible protein DinB
MIPTIQSLFAHQAWADAAILKTVREQEGAFADEDIRKLLHHIATVQRFFISRCAGGPFDLEQAQKVPARFEEMEKLFDEAHRAGIEYAGRLNEAELDRTIDFPRAPEFHPAIRDALIQVAMHSEHHRAQCVARLRALGAKPPTTDYILWVRENPGHRA